MYIHKYMYVCTCMICKHVASSIVKKHLLDLFLYFKKNIF